MNATIVRFAAAAFLCIVLGGCIAVGGTDNYTKPTIGRQLMDLKTARDTGAINDQEYQQVKSDLLQHRRGETSLGH